MKLDPELRWQDARLGQLLDWWTGHCDRLGHLPARRDFDPLLMRALLPYIYMVDVIDLGRRYRWRLIGTEITAMARRNSTGRYFDEIHDAAAYAEATASFAAVVSACRPQRSVGALSYLDRGFVTYEAMKVPLADDGRRIDMILGLAVIAPEPDES